jgi:molybdopterin converting factor subunit 1
MKIRLKVFASIRDICGFDEKELTIPESTTLEGLLDNLASQYSGLTGKRVSLLMAVNEEYSKGDTILHDNDTVALFPPVSGG